MFVASMKPALYISTGLSETRAAKGTSAYQYVLWRSEGTVLYLVRLLSFSPKLADLQMYVLRLLADATRLTLAVLHLKASQ